MPVLHGLPRRLRLGWLVIAVFTKAIALEMTLRRRPIDGLLRGDTGAAWPRLSTQFGTSTIERAIHAVYGALPFEWTCLKHALIVQSVRRKQGLPAEVRIGIQKTHGVFGAHAWVEDGQGIVLTDPLEGFHPLPLPARPGAPPPATD